MAQDVAAVERMEHRQIEVSSTIIEAEFSRIWGEGTGAVADQSSIRSRVLNLVALGGASSDRRLFDEVMEVLPEEHPCRGVLALTEPDATRLHATIGAHWLRSPGGVRHVCSEEVVLSGGRAHDREISSAVLALLLPDIPVVAWFIGTPQLEGRLAERVLDSAERAIFDSSCCSETAPFDTAERVRGEFAIPCIDLTWVRLAAWRAVIAQGFDAATGDLDSVKSIEIAGSPDSPESLLIAGWLLSRLDLTPADRFRGGNDLRATLYDGTRGVSLAIRSEGGMDLRAVRIATEGGRRTVELHADSNHLHAEAPEPGGDYARQVVQGPAMSDAAAVVAAITSSGEDSLYVEAIAAARALVST